MTTVEQGVKCARCGGEVHPTAAAAVVGFSDELADREGAWVHANMKQCFLFTLARVASAEERTREAVAASLANAAAVVHVGRLVGVDPGLPVEEFREAVVAGVVGLQAHVQAAEEWRKRYEESTAFYSGVIADALSASGLVWPIDKVDKRLPAQIKAVVNERDALRERVRMAEAEAADLRESLDAAEEERNEQAILPADELNDGRLEAAEAECGRLAAALTNAQNENALLAAMLAEGEAHAKVIETAAVALRDAGKSAIAALKARVAKLEAARE